MSWYRTYRPQTISALHITPVREALQALLASGKIPHALLFAGPRGTGKTSSARIIAKIVNCEKNADIKPEQPLHDACNECTMCIAINKGSAFNLIEIDGASNRRIDDVRELKEAMGMPPSQGKKSVFIIDEVHMLTKEAFNALLKMLEEPPPHVMFVLATTEPHKIPVTVLSRCTHIQFRQANTAEIETALKQIVKQEKLDVEDEAIQIIAQSSDGSFRDGVKMFEFLIDSQKEKKLTADEVALKLGMIKQSEVVTLFGHILAKDEQAVIKFFQTARGQDVSAQVLHKMMLTFLHEQWIKSILGDEAISTTVVLQFLLKSFNEVQIYQGHPMPLLPLELCALEMILKSKRQSVDSGQSTGGRGSGTVDSKQSTVKTSKVSKIVRDETPGQGTSSSKSSARQEKKVESSENRKKNIENGEDTKLDTAFDLVDLSESQANVNFENDLLVIDDKDVTMEVGMIDGNKIGEKWREFLSGVGKKNLSLEAILRSAQFEKGEHGRAQIKVYYGFHKEQLELSRYMSVINDVIFELLGGRVKCEFVLSDAAARQADASNISGVIDDGLVGMIEEALA